MANTRVNIDVNINTSAAAKNLRQLQAQINSFQSSLNTNNRLQGDASRFYSQQLKDLANQSGFFSAETMKMRTAASELDQTLSKGQGTMRQFFDARFIKSSQAASQVLSLANARAAALETQFVATGAAAGGFREAVAIRPLQAFNSAASVATQRLAIHRAMLMQATTSMINFGKNTQWAGRQLMVGFTVPLTIFGGMAGKVFKEIEAEIVNFKKVYGDAFTPPEELESNIEAVRELAAEYTKYGIAVKDTIGMAAKAAATGAQNADLIDATRESTRLATLGQMEQNQALETTIALQTAFGISGEGLAKTINFLNMVENQTVVTLQDLAAAIPRVAPVIKGLGGSVEDMAVMLAAMREGGVTAAQGANALKSGLASLINPSDKAVASLQKMGISLDAIVQANRGDLMGTVQDFAKALATLDDFSRQQALEQVFGKFQYARLGALFNNIIKDGSQASRVMQTAAMSAQELAASADKELGAIEEATGVKFTAAMEKFKLAIAPIGEMFLKIAIPIVNFFAQLAEKFNNLPDFAKKFAAFGAIMVGIVIPAGTMFLGLLMNLVGTLIKFGGTIGIAFKGFMTGGIKGAVDAVSQALKYMSLADIDAANASKQLGTSTEFVNQAFRDQVPAAAAADTAIDNLSRSYAVLIAQMAEAAALSKVAFVAPGAAMAGAAGAGAGAARSGPRVRRNAGGTIPGSGNTDTVPAMLTPGEFVVNKQATAENLPLLYAINKGNKVPGFNKGGQIPGMQYFARANPQRIVQEISEAWNDDAVMFAGRFASPKMKAPSAKFLAQVEASQAAAFAGTKGKKVVSTVMDLVSRVARPSKTRAISAVEGLGGAVSYSARGNVGYHTKYNQQLREGSKSASITRRQLLDDLKDPSYDSFSVLRMQAAEWNSRNPNNLVDPDSIIKHFLKELSDTKKIDSIIKDKDSKVLFRKAFMLADRESGTSSARMLRQELAKPYIVDSKISRTELKGLVTNNATLSDAGRSGVANSDLLNIKARRIKGSDEVSLEYSAVKGSGLPDSAVPSPRKVSVGKGQYVMDNSNPPNIYLRDKDNKLVNLRDAIGEIGYASKNQTPFGYKTISSPQGTQFAHANKGGMIPMLGRGGPLFLGKPHAFSAVQKARATQAAKAKQKTDILEASDKKLKSGLFSNIEEVNLGRRLEKIEGRSSELGLNGIYRIDGKTVVAKIHDDPSSALLEARMAHMSGAFGLKSPAQRVVKVKDPLTGKMVAAVISPYDAAIANPAGKIRKEDLGNQTIAGLYRRETDAQMGNVDLDRVNDVGKARYGTKASTLRDIKDPEPVSSFLDTFFLQKKGGAKKWFMENTADITRRMSSEEYEAMMMQSISSARSNAKKYTDTLPNASARERAKWLKDINRDLDELRAINWKELHNVHAQIKPGKVTPKKTKDQTGHNESLTRFFARMGGVIPQMRNLGGQIFDSTKTSRTTVPGVGTTDTVPAMLTPGEFVVNKRATSENMHILRAINDGTLRGYELGGIVEVDGTYLVEDRDGKTSGPYKTKREAEKASRSIKSGRAVAAPRAGGGRGVAGMLGMGMLLGTAGFMGGSAVGGAVAGDSGAMIGGIAASIATMLLPSRIGKVPTGGILPAVGQGGKAAAGAGAAGKGLAGGAASTANVARILPLLLNPYAAAIAIVTAAALATAITFKKMGDSNVAEYEAGRQLAKAMSTSAEEIAQLGPTARQRLKSIESYLDASEAEVIQQNYATKISQAKSKAEVQRLEQERDAAVAEKGNVTRRKAVDDFYKKEIKKGKELQLSQEQMRRLYDQRNTALGKQFQEEAQFEIDQTYGAKFIAGAGKEQLERFSSTRETADRMRTGDVSRAEANTITRLADAAYGMSMTFEGIAERDMASKLAQYVISGTMTQDQAASVAEAIGAELNDLQIGKNIRQELTGLVGVEGMTAKYSPGTVAMQLSEENSKRIEELRRLTIARAGAMFTTNPNQLRDQASVLSLGMAMPQVTAPLMAATQQTRTFDEEKFKRGDPMALNFFTQFFSGMADEFRRNVGSLIELQANEIQMLEENMSAVALNYDDLIAKAETLQEAERLRLERSRTISKLQERSDIAREKQLQMAFGTQDDIGINRMLRPYKKRREDAQAQAIATAQSRDRTAGIAPLNFNNDKGLLSGLNEGLSNIMTRVAAGIDLAAQNVLTVGRGLFEKIGGNIEEFSASSMAQLMTSESMLALKKSYEGTAMQPQFEVFQQQFNAEESPELYRVYSEFLNDPEFASNVLAGFNNAMLQVASAAEAGDMGHEVATAIGINLKEALMSLTLPTEVLNEYGRVLSSLDATQVEELDSALSKLRQNYGVEFQEQALERFLPLLSQIGQLSSIKMPGLGGQSMVEAILGNESMMKMLNESDGAMEGLMRFIEFVSELPEDLQIGFLEDKSIFQMIEAGQELNKFNPAKFKKNYKEIKNILKNGIFPEGRDVEEGVKLIQLNMAKLNEIEDPEIKATLTAEISPLVTEMLSILQSLPTLASPEAIKDALDRVTDISSIVATKTEGAKETEDKKPKKTGGGGGSKSDPLGESLRNLRDQISAREKLGKDIYAANEKAKGTFLELRAQGANEAVIDYLKSLSPEEALKVGGQLLKDQKKLNSLMGLMAQNAVVQQKESARVEKERTKAMQFLANSKVVGGMSAIFGSSALDDPEFIEGMTTAAGGKNPNKEQKQFLAAYNARKKAERKFMIAQMPSVVKGETQSNRLQQRAEIELSNKGLNTTEIQVGLENENIRAAIENRIKDGKSIGPKIINAIKSLAASQKGPIEQIADSIEDILNIYGELSNILQANIDKIEEFNIKPLEDQLLKIQKQNAEYSEQQRRLSNSLSKIQEDENDLKEEQSKKEEEINTYYDSRIKALEKVDKINKDIAQRQQDQIDVASALSRGDIGAAAKAAASMEARSAQAKRDLLLENLREQKENDIERVRTETEEKIKSLTADVNGLLLTREQIQDRIDSIEKSVYANSLLEYDIQQKITAERDKQQKIIDAQQKVARASNIVSRIGELGNRDLTQGQRGILLESIKAEVSVLGGTGAEQLITYLDSNRQDLLSGNISDVAFDLAGSLNTFIAGFSQDFANMISPEMFTVSGADLNVDGIVDMTQVAVLPPDLSTIMQDAFNSASATVQTSLDGLDAQLTLFEEEVITKNPFDTLIEGTRVLKQKAKEFLSSLPKESGGGGSGTKDKPKVKPPEPPKDTFAARINKSADYAFIAKWLAGQAGRDLAGKPYEENKMWIKELGARTNPRDYGPDPNAVAGGSMASPQDLVESTLKMYFAQGKTGERPGTKIGNDIIQGITDAILEGAIAYDASVVAREVERALRAENAFNTGSPSKAMEPLGGDIAGGLIQGILGWFTNPIVSIWEKIRSYFVAETGTEQGASTKTGSVGGNLISGIFNGITSWITSAPGRLWEAITGWWSDTAFGAKGENGGVDKAKPAGVGIISGIFNGIKSWITEAPGRLWNAVSGWWNETAFGPKNDSGGYTNAEPAGTGIIQGIFGGISSWLSSKLNIGKLWTSIWGWITSSISGNSEKLASAGGEGEKDSPGIAKSIWDGVLDWSTNVLNISSFVTTITDKFSVPDIVQRFKNIGKSISSWISSTIDVGGMIQAARDAVSSATGQKFFGGPIKKAFGGKINYRGSTESAPGMMFGGKMKKFATGSFVPGIGNTDTVPALLTPGEFVVRKSVAQAYGPLLQAINSDVFPKMNMTSIMPSTSGNTSSSEVVYNYQVNVNVTGSNSNADEIANVVLGKIKSMDARNIRGTRVG